MKEIIDLYRHYTGNEPEFIRPLAAAGSNRRYFRLGNDKQTMIAVAGTSLEENKAFITMAQHFKYEDLPVPELYAYSEDMRFYLQEDLGDVSLFDFLAKGRETGVYSKKEMELLIRTIKILPHVQYRAANKFDFSICFPQADFNERSVMWDLNYFKYCFLKNTGLEFQEDHLEDEFVRFAHLLLANENTAFMYRDFQSRNIMVKNDVLYFIDFQGGRRGPVIYDLASFLWQAKAQFPQQLRDELADVYLTELKKITRVNESLFRKQLSLFALFRTLQVLGAYGFRGYIEKKAHFIESIPFAIENLKNLLKENISDLPYLQEVLKGMIELERFQPMKEQNHLTVTVYSFSYKKGIPEDFSGNGGGFVFDCRAINNPGRHQEYKSQTGLDAPVIEFLEKESNIESFLENVYSLIDASVEQYAKRKFTQLMVSFGCTGGQHRSVYTAQKTAEHICMKYGVEVKLIHREQDIKRTFKTNN